MRVLRLALLALLLAAFSGCAGPSADHPTQRCESADDCPSGQLCHAGFCIDPSVDGQGTPDDFGSDGGEATPASMDVDSTPGPAPMASLDAGAPAQAESVPQPSEPDDDKGQSGGQDGGMSSGSSPGSCAWGPCCGIGLTLCGDACVDVLSAPAHCGKCASVCKPGFLCLGGQCCEDGQLLCDEKCVSPLKDKHHCGSCGHECEHGPCKDGQCREDP
jgi:hypothetical protein